MKISCLQRSQVLPVTQGEAWRFFSRPHNLPAITPAWLAFTVRGALPEEMFGGMVIRYRLTPLFGIPVTWISEITHVREPDYFVDEQRFGPYRFWHHRHVFEPVAGGTRVRDTVHYALGWGPAGRLLRRLLVAPRLEEIFDYRREALKRIFDRPDGPKG
jgi:ligand-binding SRPBCC domain-containing protein